MTTPAAPTDQPMLLVIMTDRSSGKAEDTDQKGDDELNGIQPGRHTLDFSHGSTKGRGELQVEAGHATRQDAALRIDQDDFIIVSEDGADWIVEGLRGDAYTVIVRHSDPQLDGDDGKPFFDAAMWFIDAADLHMPEDEMY